MIERWFCSLKTEKIYIEEYTTERELCDCIESYIDQYNNVRPHESLGYATPSAVYDASFASCSLFFGIVHAGRPENFIHSPLDNEAPWGGFQVNGST